MKLGVMIEGQEGVGWDEWRRIVQATEDLGFESLWRSDHFFSLSGARSLDALETFASLVYAAASSSRIRFGPLVLSMTFRHPAIVARMAAAIDQLSNGRFILGLGAGWNLAEHEAFGIELPEPKPRLQALEEGVRVIRALCSQESATFKGKFFRLKDASINPKPLQSPLPILIGGSGEMRTLRTVARYADEWNMIGAPIERYRQKVAALEAHCEKAGRDPATIARSLMCQYVIGETVDEVQAKLDAMPARRSDPDRKRVAGSLDNLPLLSGTPSMLVEQIQTLEAEGVSRIMLQHLRPPSNEQLELVAKELLPKV